MASEIKISTLGEFKILVEGKDVTPSASKPRTVLALLVFHHNQIVTAETLIYELWEENPPRKATATVQTYIWQLRRMLPKKYADIIKTTQSGYLLNIPDDALDLNTFERLTNEGRRAADEGMLRKSAETLRTALSHWNGGVSNDLNTGVRLGALATYWNEFWLSANELKIDVDLRLGLHHEVVGELKELASSHPNHEGFYHKLMKALYRSGRQGEALNVYQRLRTQLAAELGVEPSGSVGELHQAILRRDRVLDHVPETISDSSAWLGMPASPAQLPPDITPFIDRRDVLSDLAAAVADRGSAATNVVALYGEAGAGKSATAIRLAYLVKEHFPDGQIYVNLRGETEHPTTPLEALDHFLFSLGIDPDRLPTSVDTRASLFRSHTVDRRLLVVLDNAADTDQIQALLPNGPGCSVLITSRSELYGLNSSRICAIQPLDRGDSLTLLAATLPADRLAGDVDAVEAIISLCRGIPGLLKLAVLLLASHPELTIREIHSMILSGPRPEACPPLVAPLSSPKPDRSALERSLSRSSYAQDVSFHERMPTMAITKISKTVESPLDVVFNVVTRVEDWPQFFPPAVCAEVLGPSSDGQGDVVRRWFLGEDEDVLVRTAHRTIDTEAHRISLTDLSPESPAHASRAEWLFTPISETQTLVELRHEIGSDADDSPDGRAELARAERNGAALLTAVKEAAERNEELSELILTFDDSVFIAAPTASEPYRVLYEADHWPDLFEHVAALTLRENVKNVQFFDMDSVGQDGSTHFTRSVRICLPERKIFYKQVTPPPLLEAHTGHWEFTQVPEGVIATSRHAVTIKRSALKLLGEGTTALDARRYLRRILSANSTQNLRVAKKIAESSTL